MIKRLIGKCVLAISCTGWSALAAIALAQSPDDAGDLRARLLAEPLSPALGGDTTVEIADERAFLSIAANAQGMSNARFMFGHQMFITVWEAAPGSQPTTDGLGPVFNRSACADCHANNGRGRPPAAEGEPMDSILVRLSLPEKGTRGEPLAVAFYGDQLQDRGLEGVPAEGRAIVSWEEVTGEYADGTAYSLRQPKLSFEDLAFGDLPANTQTSVRVANPLIGLGLLEAVPQATLEALADPDDTDQDNISGRINRVWDAETEQMAVGRFGWKANAPTLRHQTAAAAIGDMGITTTIFMQDNCFAGQAKCSQAAGEVANPPELMASFFDPLVMYTQLTAVPSQRDADAPAVKRGAALFGSIGCNGCHMSTLVTGDSDIPELANQTIHPFTDLLLHDLGPGLADHREDFDAGGSEWRTPPLWGIGLTETVSGFTLFLHDGRARSLEEAVLWHGGEAERMRETFRKLGQPQRADLIAFLNSI